MNRNENSRNLYLAALLSLAVVFLWQIFIIQPRIDEQRQAAEVEAARQAGSAQGPATATGEETPVAPGSTASQGTNALPSEGQPAAEAPRVPLASPLLAGSINLRGARIDDLELIGYRETIEDGSPRIRLLHRTGAPNAYFAEFGYAADPALGDLPGSRTLWTLVEGETLAPDSPVVLETVNDKGLTFRRTYTIDDAYMVTVRDTIRNAGGGPVAVRPYGRVLRMGRPATEGIYVLHEGLIGSVGERGLDEIAYSDLDDEGAGLVITDSADQGWVGITDKYWATALVPSTRFSGEYRRVGTDQRPGYQAAWFGEAVNVPAGGETVVESRLFAGAKKVDYIDRYQETLGIPLFSNLIDWGWLYFLTQPLFYLMQWIAGYVGNWGVAILLVTVIVKLVFFPLANKSYASMARMKTVGPEMQRIREEHADDRQKQQQEMMALYKREKINPAAGCWPVLIQIPVFFALYKVIYVTLELRHAPFFGWIQDLSAPDPSSIWNLFGLIPWEPAAYLPALILLGVWPILMGITMFIQMQMNPTPPDATQAMIFRWMPVVFTFMLSTFPSGLVIYWAWNNFLSILQQGTIMKRQGAKIELWDNLKKMFSRGEAKEG